MSDISSQIFFFKGVHAEGVKISHNLMVGLPSLTGITGLGSAFAGTLAAALDLSPAEIVSTGVLFAFEDYQPTHGYKKGHKPGEAGYEAIPAAWANMTLHLGFEVQGTTPRARELLGQSLAQLSKDVLASLRFCKGTLQNVPLPINWDAPGIAAKLGDLPLRQRALAMLPSFSQVVTDASFLVEDLRTEGLPLMEGLVAASLSTYRRPSPYREFFESESRGSGKWKLVPVQDGYLVLEAQGVGQATRADYFGEQGASYAASATFTLVRLQSAASLKVTSGISTKGSETSPDTNHFWSLKSSPTSYYCSTL